MSASLVGSEMCIRDSACALPRVRELARARACVRLHVCMSVYAGARVPVSYTHLTLPTICSV
eukprot:11904938-Alexandrium_andersonii.AAC.1